MSTVEATQGPARYGSNEIETGRRLCASRTVIQFATDPLVVILLVASLISGLLGEAFKASLIAAMVVLTNGLDFYQAYSSEQAVRTLRGLVLQMATVWWDGRPAEIPTCQHVAVHQIAQGRRGA